MIAVSVQSVVRRYGTVTALNDLSLEIMAGECFGLLGPNGAGKSTLMALLAGLHRPDSGEVRIQGMEVRDPRSRRSLGLVPQEVALYGDLTAQENLEIFGGLRGLPRAELRTRCREVLEEVRLLDRARSRVGTFSGGMKRRLNLAVALLHRPRLLLCDEPTVGVDPQSRHAIFDLLQRLSGEGTTIVYSTHYMEEASRLCSRIGIIDAGRLVALGTQEQLLRSAGPIPAGPRLESLFLHLTGRDLRE